MGNLVSVAIHGVVLEWDADKVSAAGNAIAQKIALVRCESLGAKSRDEAGFKELAVKMAANPDEYFSTRGRRGEGTARPKLDMYERKARGWFRDEFLPVLKLGTNEKVKAAWAKFGGTSAVFSAKEDATAEAKAVVDVNVSAREKLLAAKAAKLKKDGWEPDLG
jgi:hypothetical protein